MISEKLLIEHCSLTLSSLKTASLFTVKFTSKDSLEESLCYWDDKFNGSGIKVALLRKGTDRALIYLYRENMLAQDMKDEHAKKILNLYGYNNLSTTAAIHRLSERLVMYNEFPHEIGLFLGYPPKDVEGFICNGGKNCSLCSYWKVYGEEDKALQKFEKYDKCNAVYKKLWQAGRGILQLTVKKQLAA